MVSGSSSSLLLLLLAALSSTLLLSSVQAAAIPLESLFLSTHALFDAVSSSTAGRGHTLPINPSTGRRRKNVTVPFDVPVNNRGSQLDRSAGYGEPLNVIVSALSSPEILTHDGLLGWARSVNFSTECLGFHIGGAQRANLGDGRGWTDELFVLRYDFNNAFVGSCLESFAGGNHFRVWQQSTTGAYFFAASKEKWIGRGHDIIPNGYDLGRDSLVEAATARPTKYNGYTYVTNATYVTDLIDAGSLGINHNISTDGRVAILTVSITERIPQRSSGVVVWALDALTTFYYQTVFFFVGVPFRLFRIVF